MGRFFCHLFVWGILVFANLVEAQQPPLNRQPFLIVSDVDDTIKITHTGSGVEGLARQLFSISAFAGMAQIFDSLLAASRELGLSESAPVYFVSGSSLILGPQIERLLAVNHFPGLHRIILRGLGHRNLQEYKRAALEQLAQDRSEQFLFFGDDMQFDQSIYRDFRERHPERVRGIYIHQVKNAPVLGGNTAYYTAFDIALSEVMRGTLRIDQALVIGQATAEALEHDPTAVIPAFARCPLDLMLRHERVPPELVAIEDRIQEGLLGLCRNRD